MTIAFRLSCLALCLCSALAHAATDTWEGSGPNTAGTASWTINAVAVSPDSQTIYAGSASGRVLRYLIADSLPTAFSFTAQTAVALSTVTVSDAITVTGINVASAISIVGGEYAVSIDNGAHWGAYTASAGTVNPNDQVKVKLTASSTNGTTATATLTIGGVSSVFAVTTLLATVSTPTLPVIPPLPVTVPGATALPPIVNMAVGEGPAFLADLVAMLSNALGQPLQPIGQNALGTVTLSGFNGGKLAFVPSNYQGSGDPRANGIYPLGDGRYQVVRNGQSLVITPALVSPDQLLALLPGVLVRQADNGVLIATFNGLIYAVQPGVQVQLDPATGSAQLVMGADGNWHFIDAQGNHQILYPAFADVTALRNALLGLDGSATLSIQLDGTAAIVFQGQRYTLVPDLTLGKVPTERVGQSAWPEGTLRFWVVNNQPLGTAQGLTVKP